MVFLGFTQGGPQIKSLFRDADIDRKHDSHPIISDVYLEQVKLVEHTNRKVVYILLTPQTTGMVVSRIERHQLYFPATTCQ